MQRPQGINAHAFDAPAEPDDAGLALAASLKRLAKLRATLYGDWSDGPTSLLDVANQESADTLCWLPVDAPAEPTFDFAFPDEGPGDAYVLEVPPVAEAPVALRGRFEEIADAAAVADPIDVSWLDLVDVDAPLAPAPAQFAAVDDEIASALAFLTERFADDVTAEIAEPAIVEIPDVAVTLVAPLAEVAPVVEPAAAAALAVFEDDDQEPAFAVGAIAGAHFFIFTGEPTAAAPEVAAEVIPEFIEDIDPVTLGAFGAAAGVLSLATPVLPAPAFAPTITAVVIDDDSTFLPCAPAAAQLMFMLTEVEAPVVTAPAAPAVSFEDDTVELAVGAFAIVFDVTVEQPAPTPVADVLVVENEHEIDVAFGAAPMLGALLAVVPAEDLTPPVVRAFDPMSLVDDALADAFDALLCAPEPIDPYDAAWAPDAPFADTDYAAHLADCESALWALPRHVPCVETFLHSPNHEIAVKITRALRVRANALEARAFTETAGFGFLKGEADSQAFWFLADALNDAASLSVGDADVDADASLTDWRVNDDGLIVVTVADHAHPKRPPPLISEEELDALFAHVDDAQSRVVLDDLGDDPTWNDRFWCDVDTYLEHVAETMDPAVLDAADTDLDPFDIHDIEVRAMPIVEVAPTTFFWMPGDDYDLAIEGDGADLFIVSANETPAVILIEDGATFAMRTGIAARMDEVVVSLSADKWRDIDSMSWNRVATLNGIAQVRVEQNQSCTRHTVMAGAFFATALEDEDVRLVLSADDGDVDYPVIRVGMALGSADFAFEAASA